MLSRAFGFAPLKLPRGLQQALTGGWLSRGHFVAKWTGKVTRRVGQAEARQNATV
jgi:hypothetical protein